MSRRICTVLLGACCKLKVKKYLSTRLLVPGAVATISKKVRGVLTMKTAVWRSRYFENDNMDNTRINKI